jgi:hypothetical protein
MDYGVISTQGWGILKNGVGKKNPKTSTIATNYLEVMVDDEDITQK